MCSSASGKAYVHEWVCVTFRNTPKLILTNPNCPQCYGTQSASCLTRQNTETHVGDPSRLRSHLPVPQTARMTWRTQTEHQSPAQALSPLRHLGLTIPARHPGHPSPYLHLGSKPDLGPHRNPNSVLHIVIIPHCVPFWPWVSYSCMHPWFICPYIPIPHNALLWLQYIRTLHSTS